MRLVRDIAFYLGLGSLLTRELDAVPYHEWRAMPLLGALPDEVGMSVFIAAHVPLLAVSIALIASKDDRIRGFSRLGVGALLVLHGLLHVLSAGDPSYEFSSNLSRLLIFGGPAFGALHLALSVRREGEGGAWTPVS